MENPSIPPCNFPGVHRTSSTEIARQPVEIPAPALIRIVLAHVVLVGKDGKTLENLSGRVGVSRPQCGKSETVDALNKDLMKVSLD